MGAGADHAAAAALDAPVAEPAQAVSSRPRDAASAQHAANDGEDAETDDPDAAHRQSAQGAPVQEAPVQGAPPHGSAAQEATPQPHRAWRPRPVAGASTGADKNPVRHTGTPNALAPDMSAPGTSGVSRPDRFNAAIRPADQAPPAERAVPHEAGQNGSSGVAPAHGDAPSGAACNWADFCDFCTSWQGAGRDMPRQHLLRSVGATWINGVLRLAPKAETQMSALERGREELMAALVAYGAGQTQLDIVAPRPYRPEAELIDEFSQRPELRHCLEVLNARLKGCRPMDTDNR